MVLHLHLQLQLHRPRHYLHPHPTGCYSNPNSLGFPKATSFNLPSLKIPTKPTLLYHKHKIPSILPVTAANEEIENLQTTPSESPPPKIDDPTLRTGGLVSTFLTFTALKKVYDTLVKGKKVYEALLLIVCIILDLWLFTVIGQRTEVPVGGNLLKTLKDVAWIWSQMTKKNGEIQNLQATAESPPPKIDPTQRTGGLVSTFLTFSVLQTVYNTLVKGKQVYEALHLIVCIILDLWLFTVIGQRTEVPVGGNLLKTVKDVALIWSQMTKKNEEEKKKAEEEGGSKDDSGGEKKTDEGEEKKKN